MYSTLSHISQSEYKDKGSKFIGYAYPCQTEEDVEEIRNILHIEHPKATHICQEGGKESVFF